MEAAVTKYRCLRLCALGVAFVGFNSAANPAWSGEWPEQSVRIVTPFGPGISPDAAARIIADGLGKRWRQTVVVDNRPGADTTLGTQVFLEARDNHTLLFTTHSTFTVVPLLRAKVPYDPVRDVKPISLAVEDYLAVAVSPTLPVGSLSDLVKMAQEMPGKLNFYAAPGVPQLAYLAFQKKAGIETTFVAYNAPATAISDLSEGRIQVAVMPLASLIGPARGGKLKLLAMTNADRAPAAPNVPTVTESGYPEFTFGGYLGFFAPKDMPAVISERIASDVRSVLGDRDVQERLASVGLIAKGSTPAEFAKVIEAQRAKWAVVARNHNIEPQ
jgi:tripartite-type tricarboxylate transporter receptor subunit TctC